MSDEGGLRWRTIRSKRHIAWGGAPCVKRLPAPTTGRGTAELAPDKPRYPAVRAIVVPGQAQTAHYSTVVRR